jgi:hypothetical protein
LEIYERFSSFFFPVSSHKTPAMKRRKKNIPFLFAHTGHIQYHTARREKSDEKKKY